MGPYWRSGDFDWAANAVSVVTLVLVTVPMFWIGRWIGARAAVTWAHRGPVGNAGSALTAPALIAVGVLLVELCSDQLRDSGGVRMYVPATGMAILVWAALTTVVSVPVVRLFNAGRALRAWSTALLGGLLALDVTAIVATLRVASELKVPALSAPLWFPLSLLDLQGSGVAFGEISQGFVGSEVVVGNAAHTTRQLLIAIVFLFGYGIAASRTAVREPMALLPAPARVTAFRPVSRVAVTIPALALALWAYGLTGVTGALTLANDELGEHHLWAHEIRQAAIVAAVTGLALSLAGRGIVVFPMVAAFVTLITADSVLDAIDAVDVRSGVLAFVGGAGVLCGAWALSMAFRVVPSRDAARRSMAGFAVLAASCAPAVAFHVPIGGTLLPAIFWITSGLAVALLTIVALLLALMSRERPLRRPVIAVPLVLVLGGVAGYVSTLHPFASFAAAPLIMAMIWVMRPVRSGWRRVAGVLAALAAAVPLGYVQLYASLMFGGALMSAAGYGFPADGLPFLPGSILVGIMLGVVVSANVVRAADPRPPTLGATGGRENSVAPSREGVLTGAMIAGRDVFQG